jgi:hypothetical protein
MGRLYWQIHKAECERLIGLLGGSVASLGGGWMVVSFVGSDGHPIRQKKQGWGEVRLYLEKICYARGLWHGREPLPCFGPKGR